MGLFAVEEATGRSFKQFIYKGLDWIYGVNELGVDMRDSAQNLIWRCILPRNSQRKYWEMALSLVRSHNQDIPGPLAKDSLRTEALRIWVAAFRIRQKRQKPSLFCRAPSI